MAASTTTFRIGWTELGSQAVGCVSTAFKRKRGLRGFSNSDDPPRAASLSCERASCAGGLFSGGSLMEPDDPDQW